MRRPISCVTRWMLLPILLGAASCVAPTPDGVVAGNEMLDIVLAGDSLRLEPRTGVKINALLQPSIARKTGGPLTFDAVGRTADSAYFVLPPVAHLNGNRRVDGRLLASACPEGKRVCLPVEIAVDIH